ncbi:MAG TPA: tyrosinase family protein [Nostocaceae cyanobacterium]|nr:tyrosinase family protein [Nostocaceae cyanobacterium]
MTNYRKDASLLTYSERQNFVKAVKGVKAKIIPGTNRSVYDEFVIWHSNSVIKVDSTDSFGFRDPAHGGPAFLPWHRFFLYKFEQELQKVVPGVTIPYWNWTQDAYNPTASSIWADDFMGGNGDPQNNNIVKTGPFAAGKWTTVNADGTAKGGLIRQFGVLFPGIPTPSDALAVVKEVPYDQASWNAASKPSHRTRLEGFEFPAGSTEVVFTFHNRVHGWVGGDMSIVLTSPNDPLFYLHHCNVDRLWALWQNYNPSQGYKPTSGGPAGHNLNDLMYPWDGKATNLQARPIDVLNYQNLGYDYL